MSDKVFCLGCFDILTGDEPCECVFVSRGTVENGILKTAKRIPATIDAIIAAMPEQLAAVAPAQVDQWLDDGATSNAIAYMLAHVWSQKALIDRPAEIDEVKEVIVIDQDLKKDLAAAAEIRNLLEQRNSELIKRVWDAEASQLRWENAHEKSPDAGHVCLVMYYGVPHMAYMLDGEWYAWDFSIQPTKLQPQAAVTHFAAFKEPNGSQRRIQVQ